MMAPAAPRIIVKVMAAARHRGMLQVLVTCVPALSMGFALATVGLCLYVWRSSASFVPGLIFPAVSELGVEGTQRRIYQTGFALCAAFLSLSILLFQNCVVPQLCAPAQSPAPAEALVPGRRVRLVGLGADARLNGAMGICGARETASGLWRVALTDGSSTTARPENMSVVLDEAVPGMLRWGHVSAAGVLVQGVVTLQHAVSMQSILHWIGAIVFLVGAQSHARASNELYDLAKMQHVPLLKNSSVTVALRIRHVILDYSSLAVFLLPLVMQAVPGTSQRSEREEADMTAQGVQKTPPLDLNVMNGMGLMQWAIILQFAFYFFTYVADLRAACRVLIAPPS